MSGPTPQLRLHGDGRCGGRLRRLARLLAWLIVPALLLGACAAESSFADPSNPVSAIPWPDYELLRYDVTDQTEQPLGSLELEIRRDGDAYDIQVLFQLDSGVRDETRLRVAAATLQPLEYERAAADGGESIDVLGFYHDGMVDSVVREDGKRTGKQFETGEFAFDNDSSAFLWRTIAFAQDYEVVYRSVNVREQRTQLVRLRVVGQDLLRVPAGEFLAWQVEVRPGLDRQSVWFDVQSPHRLVRWDLEPRRYLLREVLTQPPAP